MKFPLLFHILLFSSILVLTSCRTRSAPKSRSIQLQQQWTLNPGDEIAGNLVAGSLGDISLYLEDKKIKAPFDGDLELSELDRCALYSTPEIPAYLFRLCGLSKVSYGSIKAGRTIGKGRYLSFATLRRQPDGTWIIVEPARGVLEKALES
ncbi:hypothetical protein IQ256_20160 [cf. Phormidesmis sp. LEGE 11477]|nr:hypothetical protein [cf. Phormidesmis sp. LEGE 11477]